MGRGTCGFVGLVERIPSRLKMNEHTTKYILKKMVGKKNLIPSSIAFRKKQGFGAPIDTWFRGSWREMTAQLLDPIVSDNYNGLFDREHVRRMLDEPYLKSSRLFALTTFILWYKSYIEGDKSRLSEISLAAA